MLLIASCAGAQAGPVIPGFELLLKTHRADPAEAGLLLLGELGCANCHAPGPEASKVLTASTAPRLTGVGSRLNGDYLRLYIADPQHAKRGTTMPLQIRHLAARERDDAIDALTDFLLSSTDDVSRQTPLTGNRQRGQALYHEVGCVACHEPEASYRPASWTSDAAPTKPAIASVPLGELGRKYRPGRLAQFLLNPLRTRPSARMPRTPLSEQEAADLETYLTAGESQTQPSRRADTEVSKRGQELFREIGCASCHEMAVDETRLISNIHAAPFSELQGTTTRGCLAATPPPTAPDFGLSDEQRKALRAAIDGLGPANPSPHSEQLLMRQTLAALNCLACHERDGIGGPEPARAAYFETLQDRDLGDEGRFPPALTGVGRKLTAEALGRSIRGEDPARPYLATRMPDYGAAHATILAELFERGDLSDDIAPVERVGRNQYGRELIGPTGLGCVGCHDLKGHKSSGIGAIDLIHSPERLRVEWFRDFLINPAHFAPGTRMPSFWPNAKAVNKEVLGGNTARQIDSVWVYLMEIDQTRLPEGMEDTQAFELKPTDRPIVFRTFMTGVGMHAVAVGFPEGIHAAFDSQQVRWAQAWRGRFLNAESTWDDRFTPLTPVLSDDLVTLPPGPAFAVLGADDSPWPTAADIPPGYRFGGFRLDKNGVPTFLYEFSGLQFEDRLAPASDGRSLRREVVVHGSQQSLWFRVAVGQRIEQQSDGSYLVDGGLRIQLDAGKPVIRPSRAAPGTSGANLQELVVPVSPVDGGAALKQVLTW